MHSTRSNKAIRGKRLEATLSAYPCCRRRKGASRALGDEAETAVSNERYSGHTCERPPCSSGWRSNRQDSKAWTPVV